MLERLPDPPAPEGPAPAGPRLGILLPPLGGPVAGLGVYVREIAPRLLALHPDWVLFSEESGELPRWCEAARVVRLGSGGRSAHRGPARRLARLRAVQMRLRRELVGREIGALLVPFHDGVLRSPVPQAIVVHDLTLLGRPATPGARLARLYMQTVFRPVAARAEALIAVSESTARDLDRAWGVRAERLRVVHEGYDRDLFRPFTAAEIDPVLARHEVEAPYLFYAGTLAPHKNLATAVAALAAIADRFPALSLIVAGPQTGDGLARLREEARGRGLGSRVRALGYVEREELGPLMAAATAFVFPSRSEGFGLAALEAMASGAVVLAADRAALPEVVGDGGRLLDPDRPERWAAAVTELLEKPESGRTLRRAAVARAARFDWDRAAAEILTILRELAAPGAPAER